MVIEQEITEHYAIYNGDCIDVMAEMPNDSIDYCVFSPPFADLYTFSDSPKDLGNCTSYEQFFVHFEFVAKHLNRIIKPGRNCTVHCMDILAMKERDGYIGIKDFPGDIIRLLEKNGFIYHSRHTIWKDPLIEAIRTKAIGLMHRQFQKDSVISRAGLPDYLLTFRKIGENKTPITHREGLNDYIGSKDPGGSGIERSHNIWRAYASPVWMDIRQTRTLNFRDGRDDQDEKHICPLQLDTISRSVELWSNSGEVVFTPFMGVGSEVYGAVIADRRGIGVELKESYYRQARKNLMAVTDDRKKQKKLFL